jgi:hypothetical protein
MTSLAGQMDNMAIGDRPVTPPDQGITAERRARGSQGPQRRTNTSSRWSGLQGRVLEFGTGMNPKGAPGGRRRKRKRKSRRKSRKSRRKRKRRRTKKKRRRRRRR